MRRWRSCALVRDEAARGWNVGSLLWAAAPWAAGAVVVAALLVLARSTWLRRGEDPADRAFRRLSRVLRMNRSEQAMVVSLSKSLQGRRPVALLLSQDSFIAAAAGFQEAGMSTAHEQALTALHRKVFEER
jgi:hypothetical protein